MKQLLGYLVFGLFLRSIYCSAALQDCSQPEEDEIPQQGRKSPPSAPGPIPKTEENRVPIIGADTLGYVKTPWIGDSPGFYYYDDLLPPTKVIRIKFLDIFWNGKNELNGLVVHYEASDGTTIETQHNTDDLDYSRHEAIELSKYDEIIGVKGNQRTIEGFLATYYVPGEISFVVQDIISKETTTYGPYGHGDTLPFNYNARIIGFHGNTDITQLGFYYIKTPKKGPRFGGTGGAQWEDPILSHSPAIVNIDYLTIWHGNSIDAIQVTYTTVGGGNVQGDKHGGSGGTETLIDLEPGEYIEYIESKSSESLLGSITFTTRKMDGKTVTYGPYGDFTSSCSVSKSVTGRVIGFYGGEGDVLDSLGVYYTKKF